MASSSRSTRGSSSSYLGNTETDSYSVCRVRSSSNLSQLSDNFNASVCVVSSEDENSNGSFPPPQQSSSPPPDSGSLHLNLHQRRKPLSSLNSSSVQRVSVSGSRRSTTNDNLKKSQKRCTPGILARKRKSQVQVNNKDKHENDENDCPNVSSTTTTSAVYLNHQACSSKMEEGADPSDTSSLSDVLNSSVGSDVVSENERTHIVSSTSATRLNIVRNNKSMLNQNDSSFDSDMRCFEMLDGALDDNDLNNPHLVDISAEIRSRIPRSVHIGIRGGGGGPSSSIICNRRKIDLDSEDSSSNGGGVSNSKHDSPSSSPWLKKIRLRKSWSKFREYGRSVTPVDSACQRPIRSRDGVCPLPHLRWANRNQVWNVICKKECGMYVRANEIMISERHPHLQTSMRAVLLDWIMVVCEVYRLNRQTFYLTVDYIDRYLTVSRDLPKTSLQLLGVTCLFIASKIEEIFPPKLQEFAYVTDKACSDSDILKMELVVVKTLNWGLSPQTPHAWIKLFLQTHAAKQKEPELIFQPTTGNVSEMTQDGEDTMVVDIPATDGADPLTDGNAFFTAQYSAQTYAKVMQLVDLVILDANCLSFSYSVLATSALALVMNDANMALNVSGYEWSDILSCVDWMSSYHSVVEEERSSNINYPAEVRTYHGISVDCQHLIQSHSVDIPILEKAQDRLKQRREHEAKMQALNPLAHLSPDTLANQHILKPQWNEMTPPTDLSQLKGASSKMLTYAQAVASKGAAGFLQGSASSIFLSPCSPDLGLGTIGSQSGGGQTTTLHGVSGLTKSNSTTTFSSH